MLSTKHLPVTYGNTSIHRKGLQHKYIGPFDLGERRGENAFEVLLPGNWELARIFNVPLSKYATTDTTGAQDPPSPLRTEASRRWLEHEAT
jgi:hypothetical protein